jgi:hypothetical protein
VHQETNKGHGRIETRRIECSTALNGYINFPYAAQVFRLERIVTDLKGNNQRREMSYGVTSLPSDKATPADLLKLSRCHWRIENSLHWVRDVTFDEDRSQVRTGAGPRLMATLRNLAISLHRLIDGATNIAAALRHCILNPSHALQLVGL